MESMQVFLTMIGVLVGAAVVFFIYNVFIKDALLKGKSIAAKAESLLKKDMSSKCARCTFYMNNDYDNGYSQSEWLKLFKESVADKEWDKKSEEYAEAVAPFVNALVVDDRGYLVRRGMENMANSLERFQAGINDSISLNYFVEPYKYVKNKSHAVVSSSRPASTTPSYTRSTSSKPQKDDELTYMEKVELRSAQKSYEDAVRRHKMHKDSSSAHIYEAAEKEAFARLMSVTAKYAGKK